MFRKMLVGNRGEIAVRAFRAAYELRVGTVAVFPWEDRNSVHRLKADESYQIGEVGHPVRAYLSVEEVVAAARRAGADAVYPGYGFLSENPELAEACAREGIAFVVRHPTLRAAVAFWGATGIATAGLIPVLTYFVTRDLHHGSETLGLVISAYSVGTLVGALLAARLTKGRLRPLLLGGNLLTGLLVIWLSLIADPALLALVSFVSGISNAQAQFEDRPSTAGLQLAAPRRKSVDRG